MKEPPVVDVEMLNIEKNTRLRNSPLFDALADLIIDTPEFLGLLSVPGSGTPEANLHNLLALLHTRVITQPELPLAQFFPNLGGRLLPDDPSFPGIAADFLRHNREALAFGLTQHRYIVKTAIRRTVALKSLASQAWRELGMPADYALIDVGCSVGANLLLDRVEIKPEDAGYGLCIADIKLHVARRGGGVPQFDLPRACRRIGIDMYRIDPRETKDRMAVLGHLQPEDKQNFVAMGQVLDILAVDPSDVRVGSATQLLDPVLDSLDRGLPVIVMHSLMINFLDAQEREHLTQIMQRHAQRRELARISMEISGPSTRLALAAGAQLKERMMGRADEDGAWMTWTPFPQPVS